MKSSKLRSWSFQVSDLLMILVDVTSSCLVEWLEKMWESLREKGKGDSKEKGRGEEGKEKDSFLNVRSSRLRQRSKIGFNEVGGEARLVKPWGHRHGARGKR